jgi:tetratricopeptide (TPR) repeat protein
MTLLEDASMKRRAWMTRLTFTAVALTCLAPGSQAWAQNKAEIKKAVNKADKQILNYSPEKARAQLDAVKGADDPRVEAAMGQVLILEKDYQAAASRLEAAARKSADPMVLVSLGDAYSYAKNSGKAKSSYEDAAKQAAATLNKKPDDGDAQLALGIAQQRLKDYDKAISSLTKASSLDSSNPRIPFEMGMTQMLRGDNQAAFDQLSKAIDMHSGYAYAYYYRALAADKIGKKDITVNDLDRFLRLAPNAPEAPKAERILQSARG